MMSGAEDDFERFVGNRSTRLYKYAYLLVGQRGLAEDLLQEALVKAYSAKRRLRDPAAAEHYVHKIITRTAISWWRRKAWQAEQPYDDVPHRTGPGHDEQIVAQQWLQKHLQSLPPRQRAALVLRYYEDLSEVATSEILGCSVGAVKRYASDGLAKLREQLGGTRSADVVTGIATTIVPRQR